jgi:predicted outer membrane repeat protein
MNCSLNIGNSSFDGALILTGNPLISIGSQSIFKIVNCTFFQIHSGSSGAALSVDKGCIGNLTICIFRQGFSSVNGGAVSVTGTATMYVAQSKFIGNFANANGGAMAFGGNGWIFSNVVFSDNSASQGGALYVDSIGLFISRNVTLTNNTAFNRSALTCSPADGIGGAIFIQLMKTSRLQFLLNFSFIGNYAGSFGGAIGISFINDDSPATLSQFLAYSEFSSNRALSHGPLIGSPYQSVIIQSEEKTVYSSASFFVLYTFFDVFNQTVGSLAPCSVKIEVIQSKPLGVFQPFPVYHLVDQSIIPFASTQDFSFFKVLEAIPMPNATIELSINVHVESYTSNILNFSVLACPPGNIIVSSMNSFYQCIPCLAGTYQSYSNGEFVTCSQCPPGTYSFKAVTSCLLCPPGTQVDRAGAGEGNCFPCSPGRYSGISGGTECFSCPQGTFSVNYNQSSCESCPTASITPNNASYSRSQCVCPVGKFGQPWSHRACEDCSPVKDVIQCFVFSVMKKEFTTNVFPLLPANLLSKTTSRCANMVMKASDVGTVQINPFSLRQLLQEMWRSHCSISSHHIFVSRFMLARFLQNLEAKQSEHFRCLTCYYCFAIPRIISTSLKQLATDGCLDDERTLCDGKR